MIERLFNNGIVEKESSSSLSCACRCKVTCHCMCICKDEILVAIDGEMFFYSVADAQAILVFQSTFDGHYET